MEWASNDIAKGCVKVLLWILYINNKIKMRTENMKVEALWPFEKYVWSILQVGNVDCFSLVSTMDPECGPH